MKLRFQVIFRSGDVKRGVDSIMVQERKIYFLWMVLAIFACPNYLPASLDESVHEWVQNNKGATTEAISSVGDALGSPVVIIPALIGLNMIGDLSENRKFRRASRLAALSFLTSTGITYVGKFSVHRARPDAAQGSNVWGSPGFSANNLSFPSGHTSAVFSIATIYSSVYDSTPLSIFLYSLGVLTAYSRMHDSKHWFTDVVAGGLVGFGSAKLILWLNRRGSRSHTFMVVPQSRGLYASLTFRL